MDACHATPDHIRFARCCRAWAEGHERTASSLQRGTPKELSLAPEFWLSSAAQVPLRAPA